MATPPADRKQHATAVHLRPYRSDIGAIASPPTACMSADIAVHRDVQMLGRYGSWVVVDMAPKYRMNEGSEIDAPLTI